MFGCHQNRGGSASRLERHLDIAAGITSMAGSFLGEVSKLINQNNQPVEQDCRHRSSASTTKEFSRTFPLTKQTYGENLAVTVIPSPAPFIKNIHGLHVNKIILVCGVPTSNANRFSIYLQQGKSLDPNLVAMVFDVRFHWGTPVITNCVVRNHKDGVWDSTQEERTSENFPFQRGKEFQIIIMVERDCYKVVVDDQNFIEFEHRVHSFSCIDTLRIDGDVTISAVQVQE